MLGITAGFSGRLKLASRSANRSRKMLQNEYLVAKIGFDTDENEPPKVWGELFIIHCSIFMIHFHY